MRADRLWVGIVFFGLGCGGGAKRQASPPPQASTGRPAFATGAAATNQPDELDRAIDALSAQIVGRLGEAQKSKLAINEFLTLKGETNDLGKFLSEELTTRVINSQRAQVVERRLLQKVLSEQEMGATNLVDDETAARVGKLLGADTLCTGTLTDLGNEIKVNARLINAETAEVYGAASIDLPKNRAVLALLGGSGVQVRPAIATGPTPQPANNNTRTAAMRNPPPQQQPQQVYQTTEPQQRPAIQVGQPTQKTASNPPPQQTQAQPQPTTPVPSEPILMVQNRAPGDTADFVMFHNKTRYCVKVWLNGKLLKVIEGTQELTCLPARERSFIKIGGFGEYRVQASGSVAPNPFKGIVAYDRRHHFLAQQRRSAVDFEAGEFYNL